MAITLDPTLFLILFGGGLLAGTTDAIAGGGGLISLPILMAVGLPPHIALGTNKLQAAIGTFVATRNYFKNGFISLKIIYKGLLFGFLGTSCGALTVQWLDSSMLQKILPFLMAIILLYTIVKPSIGLIARAPKLTEPIFFALFGFTLGFYDGFLGPGTGSFWIISLVFFLGYDLAQASAYTKIFNLKSNIIALSWFALCHNVDYKIGLTMAFGQIIGGHLGSHLVIKKGAKLVRPVFLGVVTLTIGAMFYQ